MMELESEKCYLCNTILEDVSTKDRDIFRCPKCSWSQGKRKSEGTNESNTVISEHSPLPIQSEGDEDKNIQQKE